VTATLAVSASMVPLFPVREQKKSAGVVVMVISYTSPFNSSLSKVHAESSSRVFVCAEPPGWFTLITTPVAPVKVAEPPKVNVTSQNTATSATSCEICPVAVPETAHE